MALRVLLADESSTIKKVMQLALQDFAVVVKAVNVGIDVLEVARAFKPEIIFVDVLLQKKSGYDVCAELKGDAATRHTPTVLMWSSFMELDQAQLERAQPTAKIEKPFDVETLRQLVLQLVPETRSQRLAHFLDYPESVNESLRQDVASRAASPKEATIPLPPPIENSRKSIPLPPPIESSRKSIEVPKQDPPQDANQSQSQDWNMESFDDISEFVSTEDEFQPMNLSESAPSAELTLDAPASEPVNEAWAHQDLSRFKIDLPPVSVEDDGMDLKIDMGEEEFTASGFLYRPNAEGAMQSQPPATEETPPANAELELDVLPPDEDDQTQPALEMSDQTAKLTLERDEVPEPLEPMGTQGSYRPSWARENAEVPQLSADRVEEIVRAQSREIIEEVVRRVVPDIATQLIREELERLLEETSVRESRRREPRP